MKIKKRKEAYNEKQNKLILLLAMFSISFGLTTNAVVKNAPKL